MPFECGDALSARDSAKVGTEECGSWGGRFLFPFLMQQCWCVCVCGSEIVGYEFEMRGVEMA